MCQSLAPVAKEHMDRVNALSAFTRCNCCNIEVRRSFEGAILT